MSDRIETVIAETLANNLADRLNAGPRWMTPDQIAAALNEEARNVLADLKAARIALVPLPEPTGSLDPEIAAEWFGGEIMTYRDGRIDLDWRTIDGGAPTARAYAAGLLAAADAAESAGARITVEEA